MPMPSEQKILKVISLARVIRLNALMMINGGRSSHIGSVFSIADILAVLYGSILKVDPSNPKLKNRDRFILSKGHAGAGVYAALAEKGFFSKKLLKKYYKNGSFLSGHVSHKGVPGVEFSTGSLGHGLGVASGMAYAAKMNNENHRIFVIMSDGECDEGSNWEAILFAAHHDLHNLHVIVDYNKLQSIKGTQETLALEPFSEKWRAFGWEVIEVDGHDHSKLINALNKNIEIKKPLCVIAHTTKGKGVSFMENQTLWHYRSPQGEEFDAALKEINNA
jgi:transketolase